MCLREHLSPWRHAPILKKSGQSIIEYTAGRRSTYFVVEGTVDAVLLCTKDGC